MLIAIVDQDIVLRGDQGNGHAGLHCLGDVDEGRGRLVVVFQVLLCGAEIVVLEVATNDHLVKESPVFEGGLTWEFRILHFFTFEIVKFFRCLGHLGSHKIAELRPWRVPTKVLELQVEK